MDLVGSGVDQLHVIPRSTRPPFGFTQTLPDSAVKILRTFHDCYAPAMETNMRKVKPVFAHRISIFRIECHHEAIHDFTSLSHGSVDRVGSHTVSIASEVIRGIVSLIAGKFEPYSITSSAIASSEGGTARPSAFAVLRLDDQFILGGRLHREIARLLTFDDAIDIDSRAPELVGKINSIAYPVRANATKAQQGFQRHRLLPAGKTARSFRPRQVPVCRAP